MPATGAIPVRSGRRAIVEVLLATLWVTLVAAAAFAVGFPLARTRTDAALVQAAASALQLLVLVPLRPSAPARPRRLLVLVGAGLLAAALGWAVLVDRVTWDVLPTRALDAVTAGVTEEVLFRGVIWERLRVLLGSGMGVVPASAALFAVYHLPRIVATAEDPLVLLPIAGLGIVFGVLRLATGRAGLPAAVHVAVDLA